MISWVRAVSRLPVGSSATSSVGLVTMARAMATRCCWPPESSAGVWVSRPMQADLVQRRHAEFAPLPGGHAAVDQRQLDIFQSGGAGQEIVALEDKADIEIAQQSAAAPVERASIRAEKIVAAGSRRVEAADNVHGSGFAGAGRPHDGDELALIDRQIDARQRVHLGLAMAVGFPDIVKPDERRGHQLAALDSAVTISSPACSPDKISVFSPSVEPVLTLTFSGAPLRNT